MSEKTWSVTLSFVMARHMQLVCTCTQDPTQGYSSEQGLCTMVFEGLSLRGSYAPGQMSPLIGLQVSVWRKEQAAGCHLQGSNQPD